MTVHRHAPVSYDNVLLLDERTISIAVRQRHTRL